MSGLSSNIGPAREVVAANHQVWRPSSLDYLEKKMQDGTLKILHSFVAETANPVGPLLYDGVGTFKKQLKKEGANPASIKVIQGPTALRNRRMLVSNTPSSLQATVGFYPSHGPEDGQFSWVVSIYINQEAIDRATAGKAQVILYSIDNELLGASNVSQLLFTSNKTIVWQIGTGRSVNTSPGSPYTTPQVLNIILCYDKNLGSNHMKMFVNSATVTAQGTDSGAATGLVWHPRRYWHITGNETANFDDIAFPSTVFLGGMAQAIMVNKDLNQVSGAIAALDGFLSADYRA